MAGKFSQNQDYSKYNKWVGQSVTTFSYTI